MESTARPYIAITMGDPAGIGPEITAKAMKERWIYEKCRPIVFGNADAMEQAVRLIGSSSKVKRVKSLKEASGKPEYIEVLDPSAVRYAEIAPGKVSAAAGRASLDYVIAAGRMAIEGKVKAVATAPINKDSCSQAGSKLIGHMEIYQDLSGATEVATMLVAKTLRVVHLTTHRPLKIACDYVTKDKILSKVRLTHNSFEQWGMKKPRIAVAALNPHASDGGVIGDEEAREITPAIEAAQAEGINAIGPVPGDTVFIKAIHGSYDVVLAMYHDQGHIAIKVHDLEGSISVMLGLPFIRTSVDHGTAFDIAGKGIAHHESMAAAIKAAIGLAAESRLII